MSNQIQAAKDNLKHIIQTAYDAAVVAHALEARKPAVSERPEDEPGRAAVDIAGFVNKGREDPGPKKQSHNTPEKKPRDVILGHWEITLSYLSAEK